MSSVKLTAEGENMTETETGKTGIPPEYLQRLDARPYLESLQKIAQLNRKEVVEMTREQRDVIALDLLKNGLDILRGKEIAGQEINMPKSELITLGMKWGVLSAVYEDFADRTTKIVAPEPITKNEEMAIDFMQEMQDLHPEINIIKKVVTGSLSKRNFPGTRKD